MNKEISMRALKFFVAATTALVLAAFAVAALSAGGGSTTAPNSRQTPALDGSHQRPTFTRSLAVVTGAEPAPSAHPERMRALLLAGKLPARRVTATVLTDEDCAPDADGVSHCRNKLRLPGGKTIEVRHPHRMHDVPCMTPGEKLQVGRAVSS